MFQTLLEQFPREISRFELFFHFKMFWKKWCPKHSWNNFHMKTNVLNTFSISRCSERSDVPNTLEQFPYESSRFEQFFHFKMFWKKWCSKHSWNNFHLKNHGLNTFSISRCSERSDVPNTLGTISTWKFTFWTLFSFQDVLKEVMFQTLLEQFPYENSRFEHFFHFKMFRKKWCSKHSWKNFHMKTHALNTFSISRCSERSDVPDTLGTISIWKLTFWTLFPFQDVPKEVMFQTFLEEFPYENSRFEHFFHFKMFWKKWCSKHPWKNFHMKTHVLNAFSISRCSERSDVPNNLGAISLWLTFWTLFPFQDVLRLVMFQTLLEQFPCENSRFELFFHFKMFWKKWCSKHSWNNFQMKNHVLNNFSISRCSERSDVPNTLAKICKWKLTFWTLFPFQDVLTEVMFQTLLEQFPFENSRFEHFFHFKMFWKQWLSKHSWNNFHMKNHVLNTFSISRCSERSDVPNTLGTISIWKLTIRTLFPFQDVLKEVMFQTLLEQFPHENSRFKHFFHFKMFWTKWCSKHSWNNFHMKTHDLNTFSISRCSERSDVPNTLGTISIWKLTFWTLFPFQDVLKEVMFQTLLEQFPNENPRFEHFFHFKMFWKKWCSKYPWNNFHMKNHVLNTFSISRCSERSDVPNTLGTISIWKPPFWTLFPFQDVLKEVMFQTLLEQFPNENSRFEHFFHSKMFWKKWCSKHPWKNFHMKTHVLNTFSISRCSKRSDVPNTLGTNFYMKTLVLNTFSISRCSERSDVPNTLSTISRWKLTFWTLFPFQDVLKEVMSQTLLEQFPYENSRFERFFHFKVFWKKWCSKHSWNNFHMKTHDLNTFSISRCSERSDVPNTLGTISIWKTTVWTLFPFQDVLKEVMFQTLLEQISTWKPTFWTLFPFQDVLKELMFQTLLEQFPKENSRFEPFFRFKMFWKKWCSKHSWNNFHMKTHVLNSLFISRCSERIDVPNTLGTISIWKTHVLNTFSIPRCSERSDVPNTLGRISMWKLTFWTLFPFQDVLKEVMFQTLLEQFPFEKPRFEHFFHFKMFWKKWCSKHSWNNFHLKTHVLNTFSISRCSERSDVPNTLGTISTWKLTFWTLFPFKMFWKKWCSKHSWNNFHMKTHDLNTFSISRCSEKSDVPNTLGTISTWKLTFWTLFPFQDVLKEVMFQTLLEQFPYENSRFEHFFHFKMFWKKWCSKHSWNNFHMKTHVLNSFFISRCSERSDVPNILGTISMWKLTFWTLFPFQDVLKEVMFQTLLEQCPCENSRFEHFFHFKMFWKKWCSKHSWNNFHMKNHVLNTFSISRCSERSDVPNTLGTISIWKLTFWTLFPFQDVLKEVMFQTLLEQFPCENSRFEHFFHFKMFWKKWCSKHSWNNFHMKTHVLNTFSISRCSERSDVPNTLGTISTWKLTFWTLFPFQDVLKEVMFQTLLEQFPYEN